MQVRISQIFLLLSSSVLFSPVCCNPNHHHSNHNDFPWQNILSSLGIVIENQTSVISRTEANGDVAVGYKELYPSESTVKESQRTDETEMPIVAQNGTRVVVSNVRSEGGLGTGYKVGIPIVSILFFILFLYCLCKCCSACCQTERPGVVVMQPNTVQTQQPASVPQIILQQPIIHQQVPPMYDAAQRWVHPPQRPTDWNQPPQEPQWAPHPMGQQQQYSPNSGYDNHAFNPANAPPPYNTGKY